MIQRSNQPHRALHGSKKKRALSNDAAMHIDTEQTLTPPTHSILTHLGREGDDNLSGVTVFSEAKGSFEFNQISVSSSKVDISNGLFRLFTGQPSIAKVEANPSHPDIPDKANAEQQFREKWDPWYNTMGNLELEPEETVMFKVMFAAFIEVLEKHRSEHKDVDLKTAIVEFMDQMIGKTYTEFWIQTCHLKKHNHDFFHPVLNTQTTEGPSIIIPPAEKGSPLWIDLKSHLDSNTWLKEMGCAHTDAIADLFCSIVPVSKWNSAGCLTACQTWLAERQWKSLSPYVNRLIQHTNQNCIWAGAP